MGQTEILDLLKVYYNEHSTEFGITRLGVFGSVARNSASESSDIDVVVQLSKPDAMNLITIQQDLESIFHKPVDIFRYREKMNLLLKKRIDEEAFYV